MDFISFNLIQEGGLMMWPLVILSLVGLVVAIERAIFLHKGKIRAGEFLSGIKNLLSKRRIVEALTLCEETEAPIAKVIKAALLHFEDTSEERLASVQEAASVQIPLLERRVGTLSMIAYVAPLIGLLGTSLALYAAFVAINAAGAYVPVTDFTLQITQALVTSVVGLLIATVAWLAHHFLSGRVRAMVYDMEWVGQDILAYINKELPLKEDLSN